MDFDLTQASVILKAGGSLPLRSARGARVLILWGRVWLTQEGDPKDYVVTAGESVTVDTSGLTVVSALENAAVSVLEPQSQSAAQLGRTNFLGRLLSVGAPRHASPGAPLGGTTTRKAWALVDRAYPSPEELARHIARAKDLRSQHLGYLFKRLGRMVSRLAKSSRELLHLSAVVAHTVRARE